MKITWTNCADAMPPDDDWVSEEDNGELLDEFGFRAHFKAVKKDLSHPFSALFLGFLHRAVVGAHKEFYKNGKAPQGYTGRQEVARMTGLQETTIRDILILNGEIE